jgi:hypothetical protein
MTRTTRQTKHSGSSNWFDKLYRTEHITHNHAPVLDNSKSPAFSTVAQNAGVPVGAVGNLISTFVDLTTPAGQLDNVSDTDSNVPGIAVIAADAAHGTWYYSTDGGATWNLLGVPSNSASRLLAPTARLYFRPTPSFTGTVAAAITFRAWDQTTGTNGGTANTDTGYNGGTTAFSAQADTISLTVS